MSHILMESIATQIENLRTENARLTFTLRQIALGAEKPQQLAHEALNGDIEARAREAGL